MLRDANELPPPELTPQVQLSSASPAGFHSILYPDPSGDTTLQQPSGVPEHFHDLLLDQVLQAILLSGSQDFDLAPFFYRPLTDPVKDHYTIRYRQEIMQDIGVSAIRAAIGKFTASMHTVREQTDQVLKAYYHYEKRWWHLEAICTYCNAIETLAGDLAQLPLKARGMLGLRSYLAEYAQSERFGELDRTRAALKAELGAIRYNILIYGTSITVQRYEGEVDYSAAVEATFDKFRRRAVKDYRVRFPRLGGMGHVEAQILDRVALLFADTFSALDVFCNAQAHFPDPGIARFDREVQFYIAYFNYMEEFRAAGLSFSYPRMSRVAKDIQATAAFDLAVAHKCIREKQPVVPNDFALKGAERIFVVSGPNQGGKTTFARMIGQLHYLGSLGLPVPGQEVRLYLFDQLFTHFERKEDISNLRGKLQDDLVRVHRILTAATRDSLVIMNEIFSSTTLKDAIFLAKKVLERLSELDTIGVCVTFLSELATLNEKMASYVSTVDPADPAIRTFRVERRRADGEAYAMALARKYRVTHEDLKKRIES